VEEHVRPGPLQNQQLLSARLRFLLMKTVERQCPVRTWAATLAMEFLVLSMQDFLGGGGGSLQRRGCAGPCVALPSRL